MNIHLTNTFRSGRLLIKVLRDHSVPCVYIDVAFCFVGSKLNKCRWCGMQLTCDLFWFYDGCNNIIFVFVGWNQYRDIATH